MFISLMVKYYSYKSQFMHISWLAEEDFSAVDAFHRLGLGPDIGRPMLAIEYWS